MKKGAVRGYYLIFEVRIGVNAPDKNQLKEELEEQRKIIEARLGDNQPIVVIAKGIE